VLDSRRILGTPAAASAHGRFWHNATDSGALDLRSVLGVERTLSGHVASTKSSSLTHLRHWLDRQRPPPYFDSNLFQHVRLCHYDVSSLGLGWKMTRREFLSVFGGAATSTLVLWPCWARAQQQTDRVRRIGVLTPLAAADPEHRARLAAFAQSLQQLGWIVGRNVQIETRAGAGDSDGIHRHAAELVALAPDVILATGGSVVGPLLQVTRSIPIVFTQTPDPVGAGFVRSLARPSGNATGFTLFEYGTSGKWLELLKEIAPRVTRAGVLRDSALPQGVGQFAIIQSTASSFGVEVTPVDVRDAGEIERDITAFAQSANGGLIVTASGLANVHRKLIIALAAQHRLPAVYFYRLFAPDGGLICYGPDSIDPHRRAAGYVDRILRGENSADLPVQNPTKYELAINLKTAKALGLEVPATLLARADEVIE